MTTTATFTPSPAYAEWAPTWRILTDIYELSGGFADPRRPYLRAHPREWLDHSFKDPATGKTVTNPMPSLPSPKLITRRAMARVEPIGATLIDQIRAGLFRKAPTRGFAKESAVPSDHPLRRFWKDASGLGQSIDAVMWEAWTAAAVVGHMALVMDRTGDGPTLADRGGLFVRLYSALDLPDWLTDDAGKLTAVRLLESAPRASMDAPAVLHGQVRDIDETAWHVRALVGPQQRQLGAPVSGDHGFGVLPVAMLYARRRAFANVIGRSVLGDPSPYLDLYNLTSEVRELLRNQTFGILNVPIGENGDLDRELGLVGQTNGTANVAFSTLPMQYISPDARNVEVYHEHIERLIRTIYRLAVVGWETDSRAAESGDARKVKAADLHQMLAGYASECEATEMRLCELVYRGAYGDRWQERWTAEQPIVAYPDTFDVAGLGEELETAAAGLALELGPRATREIKKRAAAKLLPNLPPDVQAEIDAEIDTLADRQPDPFAGLSGWASDRPAAGEVTQ